MPDALTQARFDLAVANRICANEGIIDAFGHVSMRHPTKKDRYLLARSRSPELVEPGDIYEYDLESEPVTPLPKGIQGYGERVIHGEIYKARPDVNAVAHHHGMAFLPFCNSGTPLLRQGAGTALADAAAPSRRQRRRPQSDRSGVPHHLQLPQRRTATGDAARRHDAEPAHQGRSEEGVGAQSRTAAAGPRVGVLVAPAEEGRRISEAGIGGEGEEAGGQSAPTLTHPRCHTGAATPAR